MGTIRSKALFLIECAARAYTAGPHIHDAHNVCQRISQKGFNSTVCYWNVASDLPQHVADSYADILDTIPKLDSSCYLSVKAPAIQFDIELLKRILDRARDVNAIVHFDAMAPDTVDATF